MDLNAVLVQQVLVVHDGGNVDAQRNGVQLAIDLAGVQNGLADVGDVQRAILHIGGQVNQQPIGNILLQVRVVHLDNVRQGMTGGSGGQLVPVIVPLGKLTIERDTVGCAAGLCAALRAMGKTAYLLPNPGLTENTAPYFTPYSAPADFVPEKVVSTDIATVGLFPDNAKSYADKVDLAIDHHPSFEGFGKANIVRPEAAACGELILDIVRELTPLTPEIALPLYVAISTDTGGFIYSNVTAATHRAAAELMDTGIDHRAVNKLFFQTKSRVRMQLEAAMLADARFYDHNRAAVLSVPRSLLEKFHATESDAEDLSALGPQIQGVDCAVTMRELGDGVWKFSLRTGERVNATEVCRLLGGGGHARAAGATLEGVTQAEAEGKMLDAIARIVPDFKK